MTKEKFILICQNIASAYDNNTPQGAELSKSEMLKLCNLFFESNVVIPKGKNRHPDADLFHIVIENPNLPLETDRWVMNWKEDDSIFYKNGVTNDKAVIRYRIKPQKPIYEYLWMELRTPDTYDIAINRYMTEKEAIEYFNDSITYFAVKETKRERK